MASIKDAKSPSELNKGNKSTQVTPDPHVLMYGTATPYIALFDDNSLPIINPLTGIPLGAYMSRFNFRFDEERENEAIIVFDTGDPDTADIEEIQDGKTIYLQWGYIYPNGDFRSSKVHAVEIKEVELNFHDQGTTLTLKCKDGTSSLREDIPYKSTGADWYTMKTFLDEGMGQERGLIIEMFE